MSRVLLLAWFLIPIQSAAQYATDEVCNHLTEFENLSDSDLTEAEEYSDELWAETFSLSTGEDVDISQIFPEGWLKHSIQVQVATCYSSGKGTERDIEKAMAWLEEPAAANHGSARHILASIRLFSSDNPSLQRLGFEALEDEYLEGSAYAGGKLGWAYQRGLGVEPNQEKALELYNMAAKAGGTYWQYLLAHAYEMGYLGLEPDAEMSTYWLEYEPKIHYATYECWVTTYYKDGIFPQSNELHARYSGSCEEARHSK